MDELPDANGYTNIEERNTILLFNGLVLIKQYLQGIVVL